MVTGAWRLVERDDDAAEIGVDGDRHQLGLRRRGVGGGLARRARRRREEGGWSKGMRDRVNIAERRDEQRHPASAWAFRLLANPL